MLSKYRTSVPPWKLSSPVVLRIISKSLKKILSDEKRGYIGATF